MKETLRVFIVGMIMGAAEVVPGVSGGTIAFVTGIYERLVSAIQRFNPMLVRDVVRDGFLTTWKDVDGNFLLSLFAGMVISILSLASGVSYLLDQYPIFIWSFFFGLVIASVVLVKKQISRLGWDIGLIVLIGALFGLMVSNLVPIELEPAPVYLFLGGAVAVCAWILPGLSGSFILLMLGLYRFVLEAIKDLDLMVLLVLGLGCGIGIVSFAGLLKRLLQFYHDEVLALLTGFMLGSLVKLWPWQHTLSYQLKPDGSQIPLLQDPVSPFAYTGITGHSPELAIALIGLLMGCIGVLGLDLLARMESKDTSKSDNH